MRRKHSIARGRRGTYVSRAFALMAAALMAFMMMPGICFAEDETPAAPPAGTESHAVQTASSDTASIYVGKELTATQPNKFPNVDDFSFQLEAVRGWNNSTGNTIAASSMPLPQNDYTDHHRITADQGDSVTIQVGSFQAEANTNVPDSSTYKFRYTPVDIEFAQAGYYLYRLTEKRPDNAVPGVNYDSHSYYVVVYVCNKTDTAGNTDGSGVFVYSITSYRNEAGSDLNAPNLNDITSTLDSPVPAQANNAENLGKVGVSAPRKGQDTATGLNIGPDKLDAFRFFNENITHDVVITNRVKGNLGDVGRKFEYTVTLTGLEKGGRYTTNEIAQGKENDDYNSTSTSTEMIDLEGAGKGTLFPSSKSFIADASGCATFNIKLANNGVLVMNALPAGASYTVKALASNHIPAYEITSTANDAAISKTSDRNNTANTELSTLAETVDSGTHDDGTVTVAFANHRDLMTPTGIPYHGDYVYLMAAVLMAAAVLAVIRIRRRRGAQL